jgi:hypothetical protein
MTTLGWLGWRSIWVPPKGSKAATIPCIHISTRNVSFLILISQNSVAEWLSG